MTILREIDVAFNAVQRRRRIELDFRLRTIEDVRTELVRWKTALECDGRRGWEGWYTDQRMLYEKLLSALWVSMAGPARARARGRPGGPRVHGIQRLRYSDYNCLIPYREYRGMNDRALAIAFETSARRRPRVTS